VKGKQLSSSTLLCREAARLIGYMNQATSCKGSLIDIDSWGMNNSQHTVQQNALCTCIVHFVGLSVASCSSTMHGMNNINCGINLGRIIDCSDWSCASGFPQPLQANSLTLPGLDHDRFLPSPFQLIIPYSSYFNNVFKIFEHGVLFKSLARMPKCAFKSQPDCRLS
jgi:hypothetical protein